MKKLCVLMICLFTLGAITTAAAAEVEFAGVIEVDAVFTDSDAPDDSDLDTVTGELDVAAKLSDQFSATMILLADETTGFAIDEATIDYTTGAVSGRIGYQYVPFGKFNSSFITSPMTSDLGETLQSAVSAAYTSEMFTLTGFVYEGETTEGAKTDKINDFGFAVDVAVTETISLGGSYISNVYDTGASSAASYNDEAGAYSAYISAMFGSVGVEVEYLTAADKMDGGLTPSAMFAEVSYSVNDTVAVAARYETSDDYDADSAYGVTVSKSLEEGVTLFGEYVAKDYDANADDSNTFLVELALEF